MQCREIEKENDASTMKQSVIKLPVNKCNFT